ELVHNPEDTGTTRYSVRFDKESQSGFVFVNNYQRLRELTTKDIDFVLQLKNKEITIPKLKLEDGDTAILPFNLKHEGFHLMSSNATLLTIIDNQWVFYHPRPSEAEMLFNGEEPSIILLSEIEANQAFRNGQNLCISDGD